MSGTNDQIILVGAASKGIIQREFQHNATVYKTPYAKNPFDAVTDEELENYKKDITRKQRGDSYRKCCLLSRFIISINCSYNIKYSELVLRLNYSLEYN